VYKALVEELVNENLIRVSKGGREGGREGGLASHHAGLLAVYKALVEELVNENLIRVSKGGREGGREGGRARVPPCRLAGCVRGACRRIVIGESD